MSGGECRMPFDNGTDRQGRADSESSPRQAAESNYTEAFHDRLQPRIFPGLTYEHQ